MKKISSILLLAALLTAGAWFWSSRQERPIALQLATAEHGEIRKTVSNTRAGSLKACRRAHLSPALGGSVSRLLVSEGDRVEKDSILLELWNEDVEARLQLAEAQLKARRAQQSQTCIQADLAGREAARQLELLRQGLTSDEQAERSSSQARAQRAACQAARANSHVAEAQLRVAEAALERSRLRAAFDGIVASLNVELGEYISPAPVGIPSDPVIDLIDDSCHYIRAPMDEVDAPNIEVDMSARVSLDAFPGQDFAGQVRRIADFVLDREKQARTVDIEVDLLPTDRLPRLLPGYTADVEVILARREQGLRIPTEALFKGNHVYVFDPQNGRVRETEIRTGIGNWQYTEVLDGLEAGQQVVVSLDRKGLADGVPARPESGAE